MVADDNPVNQLLMRHLLAAHDIVPVVVSNGREVIAYLRKHPDFHLVLMDIQMPELRGDEAARLMRDELKLNIPVVAISAYDEETSRVKTGDWAPDAFINKPIHPDAIERILNDLLPDDARTCIPWVDIPWLQKNFNGDQTFIRQMIGLFASQLIAECRLLEAAIAKKDASEMDRIAHQIISTVGSVSPGSCLLYHLSVLRQLLKEPEPDWMVISLNFQVFSRLSRQAEAAAKALIE
jgi:CheY-like chemotaxis protein